MLTHSPRDILRRALIQLGLGADPPAVPWPIYSPTMPPSPDNCIATQNTPNRDGGRDTLTHTRYEDFGVQVMTRATTDDLSDRKAAAIGEAMDSQMQDLTVVIGASTYLIHSVTRVGGVNPLGKEANSSRFRHTVNGLMTVTQL